MTETLMNWWPLVIGGAIVWAGHMISAAVTAASNQRSGQFRDLRSLLSDMRSEVKFINDSVKRVEQRLPPPPEHFG